MPTRVRTGRCGGAWLAVGLAALVALHTPTGSRADEGGALARDVEAILALYRDGASGLGVPAVFRIGASPERSIGVLDVDADGRLDLAISESASARAWLLRGVGDGSFGEPTAMPAPDAHTVVAVGDFDGDRNVDRAVADRKSGAILLRYGDGDGGFTTAGDSSEDTGAVVVTDFDGDGNVDLAIAGADDDEPTIRLGDGRGGFGSPSGLAVGSEPTALAVADFDRDGAPDLAVADRGSRSVSILLGDGRGRFAGASVPIGLEPASIAAGDLDGDGIADLAAADDRAERITVLLGSAMEGFPSPTTIEVDPSADSGSGPDADRREGGAHPEVYQGVVSLALGPTTIAGGSGGTSTGTVELDAPAPAGGVVVTLASSNAELAATLPSVTVPAGGTRATFTVSTNRFYRRYSGLAFNATISAAHGATTRSATLNVTSQPRPTDTVLNPDTDLTGLNCAGEPGILFDCKQGPNSFTQGPCFFKQECTLGCLTRPSEGRNWRDTCATSGPFPLALSPRSVVGGNPIAGTVLLGAGAPAGSSALVRGTLHADAAEELGFAIPTGATSRPFTVLTAPVDAVRFASLDGFLTTPQPLSQGGTFFARRSARTWAAVLPGTPPPVNLISLALDSGTVRGGLFTAGRACIDQLVPDPALGVVPLVLSSSYTAVATVFSTSFPQGSDCAVFGVQTVAVSTTTAVTLTATLGAQTRTVGLTVTATPPATRVTSFFLDPLQVVGGSPATGTVVLNGLAPAGGAVVTLVSSNPAVVLLPSSVTVAGGNDRVSFAVLSTAVGAPTSVTLSATYGTGPTFTSLSVLPPPAPLALASLALSPASVVGGSSSTGTVTLSAAAFSGTLVLLTSSNNAVATVPASVTVAAGATTGAFTVSTSPVGAATSVTISASFGGSDRTALLGISPLASGPLPAPTLVSPAADARFPPGQTITFDWSDVSGAASYTIQIDDAESFTAPLVASASVTLSRYTNSTLPTRRMWWRARAHDAAGTPGSWSSVRRFEVK